MKCEHCGKNEATFYYKSNVNGHVTESHLCQSCAQQSGLLNELRRPALWDGDFFPRPFRMLEPLLGSFGSRLLTEFPEPVEVQARQAAQSGGDELVQGEEREKLSRQRQRNALQSQLRRAVETENFEEAARLRDRLRSLPQQ